MELARKVAVLLASSQYTFIVVLASSSFLE